MSGITITKNATAGSGVNVITNNLAKYEINNDNKRINNDLEASATIFVPVPATKWLVLEDVEASLNNTNYDACRNSHPVKPVTKRNVSGSSFESMVDSLKRNGYWSNVSTPDSHNDTMNKAPKYKAASAYRSVRSVRSGNMNAWFKSIGTIGKRREGGEVREHSDVEAEMLSRRGSKESIQSAESGRSVGMKSTADISPLIGQLDTEYKGDNTTLSQLWESSSAPMHWRDQEAFLTHTEINNRRQSRQSHRLSPSSSISPTSKDALDGAGDCDIQPLSLDETIEINNLKKAPLLERHPFALKVAKINPLDGTIMRIKEVKDGRLNSHGNLRDVLDIQFNKPNSEIVVAEALARPRCGGTPYEREMMTELRQGQEREAKEVNERQKAFENANRRERFEATIKMLRGWK